ncbi:MAG: 3-deoxy-8-phosphooctulonate synthase [Elusimicrobiota bacterium]
MSKSEKFFLSEERPVFVAGPCVIENFSMLKKTALFLDGIARSRKKNIVFKASYDKANRTSGDSFRGPGLKKGLQMLAEIKKEIELPILVDIHCSSHARAAAEVADCLQIPAFLCRQTDLIKSAASTGAAVNIKKGQFMSPYSMKLQAEKALSSGNGQVIFTERGTVFGYGDLVVDMRAIVIMKEFGFPVLFDVTHSLQKPSSGTRSSGGDRRFLFPMSRAAMACGADGIYAEVHPDPDRAKSDRKTQIDFNCFERMLDEV